MHLFEHQSTDLPDELLIDKDFRGYLDRVWENRKLFYELDQDNPSPKQSGRKGENILYSEHFGQNKKKLVARNYVGIVQYNGYKIHIWPKIFSKYKNDENKKLFLNHLLYYCSYSKNIKFPFTSIHLDEEKNEDLIEAFIRIFANYSLNILSQQPYQRYEEVSEEMLYMRGHLNMALYIKEHLSTGKWNNLYCEYEPFIYDNLFNRIVKYTCRYLINLSKNSYNELEKIIFLLDEVTDQTCTVEDCNKITFNPIYQELLHILDMCRMFLSQQVISTGDDTRNNFSFFLPMEKLFEDFIAGFIEKHFSNEWNIRTQASDLYLTSDKLFQLKQDILLTHKESDLNIILDTKYKKRDLQTREEKYGISQADMYQMVSYIVRREKCNKALLLYPKIEDGNKDLRFEIEYNGSNREILEIFIGNINVFSKEVKNLDIQITRELRDLLELVSEVKSGPILN